jgi:gliding motility-associated-like protein
MKKITVSILIGISMFINSTVKAQLNIGSDGLFVGNGTVFYTDGLTIVPSKDWKVNNLNIMQESSTVIWPKFSSIERMYRFSRPIVFIGELGFNYQDVALNGNEEKNLVLAYTKATSNNYNDFNLVQESSVNPAQKYISQLFGTATNFSDLTAVSTESSLTTPYTDLEANNMITPNGDGINDIWIVKNIEQYPNNELNIFDREGRLVFTTIGYDNSWSGQSNGSPLGEGTYYYILYIDSGKSKKSGFISIVKEKKN